MRGQNICLLLLRIGTDTATMSMSRLVHCNDVIVKIRFIMVVKLRNLLRPSFSAKYFIFARIESSFGNRFILLRFTTVISIFLFTGPNSQKRKPPFIQNNTSIDLRKLVITFHKINALPVELASEIRNSSFGHNVDFNVQHL